MLLAMKASNRPVKKRVVMLMKTLLRN
jgi:hypothetical protein